MTDTLIGAYIGVGGAIIGAIIAGPIAYYFSQKLIRQTHNNALEVIKITEHNKSVAAFRATFAHALAFLNLAEKHRGDTSDNGISISEVDKFLRDSILNHASAIEQFRPFMPESDRTAYQKAWEDYRYEVCNYGFVNTAFRTDVDNPYERFKDFIHIILQFAKEK